MQVDEEALGPTAIEGVVGKLKMLCITHQKFYGEVHPLQPFPRHRNHGLATVDSHHAACSSYLLRQCSHVVPEATADIQQVMTFSNLQQIVGSLFHPLHDFEGSDRVQVGNKRARISCLIDCAPSCYRVFVRHDFAF